MASIFTNKSHRIDHLKSISIFSNLPKKELQEVERFTTPTRLEVGTELTRQDRAPSQAVLLVTGAAKVMRNNRKIASVGPGEVVGELSLLDGGAQTATVVVTEEAEALALSVSDFTSLLASSPTFARNLLKSVAAKLRNETEK